MKKKVLGLITLLLTMMLLCVSVAAAEGDSPGAGGGAGGGSPSTVKLVETSDYSVTVTTAYSETANANVETVEVTINNVTKLDANITAVTKALKTANKKADKVNIYASDRTKVTLSKEQSELMASYMKDKNSIFISACGSEGVINISFNYFTGTTAITNAITVEDNSTVAKKLKDAKVTNYIQYTIAQKGTLPGKATFDVYLPSDTSRRVESLGFDSYVYRYDASSETFEFVNQTGFGFIDETSGKAYVRVGASSLTQGGTYVVSKEILPEKLTGKKVVTVETEATTSKELATDIKTAIDAAKSTGEAVKVEVAKGLTVSEDVFKAAKDSKVPISVVSTAGTPVKWAFVEIATPIKDFDPTVEVGAETKDTKEVKAAADKLAKEETKMKYETVSFAYDGDLPGATDVQLDLSSTSFAEGSTVYLYYFNGKTFEKVDSGTIADGFATFTMTHCSEYIVTDTELTKAISKMGDSTKAAGAVIIVLVGVALLAAAIIFRKRRI